MSNLSEFFFGNSKIIQYETLEITHNGFTQPYYLVRNNTLGIQATTEEPAVRDFAYYPMRITPNNARDNLDFGLTIDFGDLGDVLATELASLRAAGQLTTKPQVIYRTYRSDDLQNVLYGPLKLEITAINFNAQGATFEANAPVVSIHGTGEVYSIGRFPTLKGFL